MQYSTLLFMNIGTPEMMLILGAALLMFGGKKLPELARGLGKGIREFKDASDGVKREIHNSINKVQDDLKVEVEPEHSYKQPELPESTTDSQNYSDPYHHYYAPPINSEPIDPKAQSVLVEGEIPAEAQAETITEITIEENDKQKVNPSASNQA